jgi:hypothetical protein
MEPSMPKRKTRNQNNPKALKGDSRKLMCIKLRLLPGELAISTQPTEEQRHKRSLLVRNAYDHFVHLEQSARQPATHAVSSFDIGVLNDVITNAWRAKQKLLDKEKNEPRDDHARRASYHLDGIFESMKDLGVVIDESVSVNRLYDTGMDLTVVAWEPTPGLSRELIIEIIKPAIKFKGRLAQRGEVIVGTPVGNYNTKKEEQSNE